MRAKIGALVIATANMIWGRPLAEPGDDADREQDPGDRRA